MMNCDIVKNVYLMHYINEQLEVMVVSTVFMKLDITKWYHQRVIHPDSKPITVFSTPKCFYQ